MELDKIKQALRYGDLSKIAKRTRLSEAYCGQVIRGVRNNIHVLKATKEVALERIEEAKQELSGLLELEKDIRSWEV